MKKNVCNHALGLTFPGAKKTFLRMKLTLLIILFSFLGAIASESYSQTTKLSLDLKNTKVKDVLGAIENQSEFFFLYSEKVIDVNREVNIEISGSTIDNVLDKVFSGTNVAYTVKGRQVVLSAPEANTVKGDFSTQQQKLVSGKVTDSSGSTLPGVSVVVKGTTLGTITDIDGKYSLSNVPANATLLFSFVGMRSQEIVLGGKTSLNVVLLEESIGIEEVVAIGYGVQKKSVTTGAIASVSSEDIANTSVTLPAQALQGKSSGVQVTSTSGAPGAEMKVRIRGYSSNGNSDPLFIVDGVKTTSIGFLDPNDITSMEVLKDAASASIYGAEGGNGVILITTKKAKSGTSTINYELQHSIQTHGKLLDVLNAQEYANYYNEAGIFNLKAADLKYDTDWMDKVFEKAPTTKHYISFSKGNEVTNVLLSLSSLNSDGIVVGNKDNFKRYTFRMNAETKVTPWMKVGNNTSFSTTQTNSISEDDEVKSVIGGALRMDPLTPVFYEDNAIPAHVQALLDQRKILTKNENGQIYGISNYLSKEPINPFVRLANNHTNNKSSLLQGSLYTEITPLKDLTFTSRLGYEIFSSNTSSWLPTYFYNGNQPVDTYNEISKITESFGLRNHWLWENYLNYNKKIGENSFAVLLGTSAEHSLAKSTIASGGPMSVESEDYAELDYITAQTYSKVSGNTYVNRKESFFGRLSYDYKGKYLLMTSVRRDGAGLSYLPKEQRWGVFPSVSTGWVFTEESFFPDALSFLNYGKLRASWGQNGSLSNLSNYMYASSITTAGLLYQASDGSYQIAAVPNRLNNPELTWETSSQTDIGLDLRFFNSKLDVTFDYYNKKTINLLTQNTPPYEAGNTAPAINGGDVSNKGLEFAFNYRNSIGKLKYGIKGNISYLKNKVTYLDPTISRIQGFYNQLRVINYFEKGFPVWYFRGYKTDGINPTTGEVNLVDLNSDGIINDNDKTMIGNPIPKYTFGAGLDLSYKGFDFSATAQGQAGNDIFVSLVRNDMPGGNYPKFIYDNRWIPTNTTGATMPKAGGMNSLVLESDLFVEKGDFIRIKQIQLGYTFEKSLLTKVNVKAVRIYISLEDYFTLTKYRGMDPEAGSTENSSMGTDRGMYPITKKALFGLSVTF